MEARLRSGFFDGENMKKGELAKKTIPLLVTSRAFLQENAPVTVRQLYYHLVSKLLIPNSRKSYNSFDSQLTRFRELGHLPWEAFTDPLREVRKESSWVNVEDFLDTVKNAYRRSLNSGQQNYIEVWLEKDALSGIIYPITSKYDTSLLVGRGFFSGTALHEAAKRLNNQNKPVYILYFGDFDPSGEDIARDIQNRLAFFGINPLFQKISLTRDDIETYSLPPIPTKKKDTRSKAFVAKHGDVAVELDALPPDVLRQKVEETIVALLNLAIYEYNLKMDAEEKKQINTIIEELQRKEVENSE